MDNKSIVTLKEMQLQFFNIENKENKIENCLVKIENLKNALESLPKAVYKITDLFDKQKKDERRSLKAKQTDILKKIDFEESIIKTLQADIKKLKSGFYSNYYLLEKLETEISRLNDSDLKHKINDYNSKISINLKIIDDIKHQIETLKELEAELDKIDNYIDFNEKLNALDMLGGGSVISSAKYAHLNLVHKKLKRLKEQYQDISIVSNLKLTFPSTLTKILDVLDHFFSEVEYNDCLVKFNHKLYYARKNLENEFSQLNEVINDVENKNVKLVKTKNKLLLQSI